MCATPTATASSCSRRDYLTVDPDLEPIRWSLRDPQRQTLWGHPAPKSWFEEGSLFAGVAVREPALAAQPIVAR